MHLQTLGLGLNCLNLLCWTGNFLRISIPSGEPNIDDYMWQDHKNTYTFYLENKKQKWREREIWVIVLGNHNGIVKIAKKLF